jgi:hypothetical protein
MADLIISTLAIRGIAMAPLPLPLLAGEFAAPVLVFGSLVARLGVFVVAPANNPPMTGAEK